MLDVVDRVAVEPQACFTRGNWYVAALKPRHEQLAKGEIAKCGLVVYLPMAACHERHGRGSMRTVWRPMFGAYLFVKLDLDADDDWRRVTSARGVRRLLGQGGNAEPVPMGAIEAIRLYEGDVAELESERIKRSGRSGLAWHFTPGETVRIKAGPFAQFYAELETAVDSHDRIRALVSIFGRSTALELSALDIEKI